MTAGKLGETQQATDTSVWEVWDGWRPRGVGVGGLKQREIRRELRNTEKEAFRLQSMEMDDGADVGRSSRSPILCAVQSS